ncbi:LexA DNA binding domain-containing protein [Thalassobacillus cyri]|uniref:LexA DNA binding domain-containing protein n=1 Tax=Thalassobacillus cyri TaxID=571932 RepID=A0A1H4H3I3_9BACI|nr:MarR family transcriptional regulator [Thalassobacillus cyri]SEB15920.1 LexA DNA binding domain-containing protein [Thalassobacillus cyri]
MKELTQQQKRALDFIEASIKATGHSPTVREVANHLGVSSASTAHRHITRLKEKGYLENKERSPRSFHLVSGSSPERNFINALKDLDDDTTDIIFVEGEPFKVQRATIEDIREWRGESS